MRVFEFTLLCLLPICLLVAWLVATRATAAKRLGIQIPCLLLLAGVLAAHMLWEGAHWQMIPAYGAALLVGLLLFGAGWSRSLKIVSTCLVVLLGLGTCATSYVFPVFKLPKPSGPYMVGTRIVSMVDTTRAEDAEANSGQRREVVVQIWYPAWPSHAARAPYRRRSETSLASSYLSVDWTNSRYDAPVATAPGGFPILVYNPGWNGRRTQNTPLMEELASHGYVVVGIDHPYNSGPVALADGRVIKPVPAPELFDDVSSEATLYALIDKEAEKETLDAAFVLGQVEQMNEDPANILYHHMDRSRIGALGYSLGGMVAANLAYRNPRIGAVLVLDTPITGDAGKKGIEQPFMLICEDLIWTTPEEKARMSFGERRDVTMDEQDYAHQLPLFQRPGNYEYSVHGTVHSSFQDSILTSPLQSIAQAGTIAPNRMIEILREYSVAFFNQSLRGRPASLLALKKSPFAEVTALWTSEPRERGVPAPSPAAQ